MFLIPNHAESLLEALIEPINTTRHFPASVGPVNPLCHQHRSFELTQNHRNPPINETIRKSLDQEIHFPKSTNPRKATSRPFPTAE